MNKLGIFTFALRMQFSTLMSMVGSGFVGAVFGAYATGANHSFIAILTAVFVIIAVSLLVAYAQTVSGVNDDELELRQQAAAFIRHVRQYEKYGLPDESELVDLRKATSAYRRRVGDKLAEAEHTHHAAKRRHRILKRHHGEVIRFEKALKCRNG